MKNILALLAVGILVSTTLLGCGTNPSAAPKQLRKATPAQQMAPAGPVGANQAGMDPKVQQLLAAVRQTNQVTPGFTATIETYDKGATGSNTQTMAISFKKPNSLKINILKDGNGNDGVQAFWSGSETFQVKPKFPPITVSLGVSDKRLTSQNGWTIKDTGVSAILNVLLNNQSQIKLIGDQPVNGKMMTMLEVRCPASPKGATHEIIGVDPQNNMPSFRAIYKGQQVLYRLTIKTVSLKAPTSAQMSM